MVEVELEVDGGAVVVGRTEGRKDWFGGMVMLVCV